MMSSTSHLNFVPFDGFYGTHPFGHILPRVIDWETGKVVEKPRSTIQNEQTVVKTV